MKIPESNYTQIPNEVIDTMASRTPAQNLILIAVCRKTFGWRKENDRISISQFQELTGLSRQGVLNCIDSLIEIGCIERRQIGNSFDYSIVVDSQLSVPPIVNSVDQGSQLSIPEMVNSVDTQNKKETKEKKLNKGFDSDGNKPIGIDSNDNFVKAQAIKVLEDYIYSTLVTALRHSQKRPARKSAEAIATAMMMYYAPDGGEWYRGKGNKRVAISSWKRCCATFVNNAIAQNKIEFEEIFIPLEQRARRVQ